MNCEQFERIGLDAERDDSLSAVERDAARQHASCCAQCARLQQTWAAAKKELQLFAAATSGARSPARVEMRLRQEFYTRHHTMKVRRLAAFATTVLAAAAVAVALIAWRDWKFNRPPIQSGQTQVARNLTGPSKPTEDGSEELMASTGEAGFTALPGMAGDDLADTAVVRVRMQRAALSAWGLPVSEERAGDWIQVDLLVGDDGQPQAVRLGR
jgi:hypothetical protein